MVRSTVINKSPPSIAGSKVLLPTPIQRPEASVSVFRKPFSPAKNLSK